MNRTHKERTLREYKKKNVHIADDTVIDLTFMFLVPFQYLRRVRQMCAVMDIPVYDNLIESMHVLFTTYMEFNSNAHFMQLGGGGGAGPIGVGGYK